MYAAGALDHARVGLGVIAAGACASSAIELTSAASTSGPIGSRKFLFGEPKPGRFTAHRTGTHRQPLGKPFKASELNQTAKIVCAECNGGWMNELETAAAPFLKPMLRGNHIVPNIDAHAAVRAWVLLRGMILEHAGGQANARHFYTQAERLNFVQTLEPVSGTFVWLFHCRTPQWAARANVANMGTAATDGQASYHLQLTTAFAGRLGFQILLGRWPPGRTLGRGPAVNDWETAAVPLLRVGAVPVEYPTTKKCPEIHKGTSGHNWKSLRRRALYPTELRRRTRLF